MSVLAESDLRIQFFDMIYGEEVGWLCLATTDPLNPKSSFTQRFFNWPKDIGAAEEFILQNCRKKNMYFCINLLNTTTRRKENCLPTNLLWADLDTANPEKCDPGPSIVIESSPGRYQAIWRLTTKLEPSLAEAYSKRLAYAFGADKSGWDLTQLLRIPFTTNFKYQERPKILPIRTLSQVAPPLIFEVLPPLDVNDATNPVEAQLAEPIPGEGDLPEAELIIYKYQIELKKSAFFSLYEQDPEEGADWSSLLWRILHICFEVGMNAQEVFAVAKASKVNKYSRDNRPLSHLWRDVLKAQEGQDRLAVIIQDYEPLRMPQLVDLEPPEDHDQSFIHKYRSWAEEATDAIPDFHDLSAFILLSSLISNSVRLHTSYGAIVPNLWGLVLGDSTLSRKTTAMRMVTEMLQTIDPEMIVATDGSVEGLFSGLETRPNQTSIFFRDEVSGFFEAMNRKDYLAGMQEHMSQLYDVPPVLVRRLRKETVKIENPVFIFFGGGVRSRVFNAVNEQYVLQGFLPRFIVVSGDTDLSRIRPTGPANPSGVGKRASIMSNVADIYERYGTEIIQTIGGEKISMPPRVSALLTDEAWAFNSKIEAQLSKAGHDAPNKDLAMPTFERMGKSLLKMAIILGASRQTPTLQGEITIEERDMKLAAWYIQRWGPFQIELIANAGKSASEKQMERVLGVIMRFPGIMRSQIMQQYHLTSREMDEIVSTLSDRQLIRKEKVGNGTKYWIS